MDNVKSLPRRTKADYILQRPAGTAGRHHLTTITINEYLFHIAIIPLIESALNSLSNDTNILISSISREGSKF